MDLDFLSSLVDEVALEGLDGITLPMLWVRLQNRPNFSISLDDDSKLFLWECIAVHKDIEIFELPKSRPFVPLYNRYDHIDPELGIVIDSPETLVESYPIAFVKDGDIRGSCATYKSRVCITSEIRYDDVLLMNLNKVIEKWGEKLVLVASPRSRLLALIGTEISPLIDMSQEEYCLLERVGRSRYHGEVTPGEGGLLNLKAPFCKQLHYYRKKLTLKGLMTKQLHYIKTCRGNAATGSLFQLTRFFVTRKTKLEFLLKCACDILKGKPNNRELTKKLREELGIKENTFKKMFYKPFEKCLKMRTIPYKEYDPLASKKECYTQNGHDRIVKVVQLLKHCDEVDAEDDEIMEGKQQFLSANLYFNCSKLYFDFPLTIQTYTCIQDAGPRGLTASDLGRMLTLPRLDTRIVLKLLLRRNVIDSVLQERGRQKETFYIAKHFVEQNEDYSTVKKGEEDISQEPIAMSLQNKRKFEDDGEILKSKKVHFSDDIEDKDKVGTTVDTNLVDFDFTKIVSEVSEIQNLDVFTGKNPRLLSMTEKAGNPVKISKTYRLTYRKLKRMNMVLDHLKTAGFCTLGELQKYLTEKEKEEGYNFKIDKKSSARMMHCLHLAKKLKIFKAVLTLESQRAEMEFICDTSVKVDDPSIQAAVDQAKFKFFSISKDKAKMQDKGAEIPKEKDCIQSEKSKKYIEEKTISTLLNEKILQEMKVHPKFLRIKTMHKFLFYLVYNFEGHSGDNSKDPTIYHDSMSWKKFVPPLPQDSKEGWCFLADVYNRMPLSIFVRVINFRQKIKEFGEYLRDKEKSNYPITYLPKDMLKSLLERRKYLFSVDEVLKNLCYLGLVTYGPQVGNLKDHVHIYVHKNATIKDTTISTPGYIHINSDLVYEKKSFTFNSLADVDKFWAELEYICSNTTLGRYSSVFGKTLTIPLMNHKPELLAAIQHKNFDEISDVGFVPGDQLGAGGFDSSLFMHCRRNWQPSHFKENEKPVSSTSNENSPFSLQNLLKQKEVLCPDKSRLQRLGRHQVVPQKDKTLKEKVVKSSKSVGVKKTKTTASKKSKSSCPKILSVKKKRKKVIIRTVHSRSKKLRTPYLDEKDKVAVQKMSRSRSRCEWSAQEDSFLLLCKVTSAFLDHSSRTLVVPFTVVRDLLHEQYPDLASTKTSRACQRRVKYMMMNPTTMNNVTVFLGEAKQDLKLVKDYDKPKPNKTNESVWKEYFTDVLKRLLRKFTLPAADRCKHINLPESMELFRKSFVVLPHGNVFHRVNNHKDPVNEEDLKYSVLYALINSAMAIVNDGTEWSYLLYKLYHVYPEYILKSVVTRLRSDRVIACKRPSCKRDFLPSLMTTFPYRFSITFENTLVTKFPIKIFNEAKEFLDKFKMIEFELELKDRIPPGYAVGAIALVLLNDISLSVKIPDQVILFDITLSKEARTNIVERMMHSLSDKESEELSKILNDVRNFPHNTAVEGECSNTDSIQIKSEDVVSSNEIQRSTNASRFALYLLRQELSQPPVERAQHSQDYIVLNSCQIICQPQSNTITEGTSENISHQDTAQLQKNKIEQRTKILTDGCISEIKASLTAAFPAEAFTQYNNFEESIEMIYDAYSPQTLNDAKSIFEEIFRANVIGVSEKVLWEKYQFLAGELSLFEHLHLFREAMLVVRAGVASFVYVCICYSRSWFLQSFVMPEACYKKKRKVSGNESSLRYSDRIIRTDSSKNNLERIQSVEFSDMTNLDNNNFAFPDNFMDTGEDDIFNESPSLSYSSIDFTQIIYFLPRTWRHPDGTLNRRVFVELLQTILSYVVHSPGVSTSRIIDRFALILQPVQILELLEILEKACCIEKSYCKKPKRGTLFSPLATVTLTKNPEPRDLDHLEPLPDAVCNLIKIQEAIL